MKNSHHLFALALSFATPAIATCLYLGGALSTEILLGTCTIAGLFYIAATDYSPRITYRPAPRAARKSTNWIRRSFDRSSRTSRQLQTDKSPA